MILKVFLTRNIVSPTPSHNKNSLSSPRHSFFLIPLFSEFGTESCPPSQQKGGDLYCGVVSKSKTFCYFIYMTFQQIRFQKSHKMSGQKPYLLKSYLKKNNQPPPVGKGLRKWKCHKSGVKQNTVQNLFGALQRSVKIKIYVIFDFT